MSPTATAGAIAVLILVLYGFLSGNDVLATKAAAQTLAAPEALDRKKLEIEEKRLALEREKLKHNKGKDLRNFDLEEWKASLTALSIAVPLLGGLAAYLFQIWSQGRNESLPFKLKAAEVAMNARDSNQVQAKAAILKALFPKELEAIEPEEFNPKKYPFSRSIEDRESLITLLAAHPNSREEIIRAWGIVFPWHEDPAWSDKQPDVKNKYRWFDTLRGDPLVNRNRPVPEPTK